MHTTDPHPGSEDVRLTALTSADDLFTRGQALQLGVDDVQLNRWRKAGDVWRVRRGMYTRGATWRAASEEQRHVIEARAALKCVSPDSYLTGVSALIAFGVDLYDPNVDFVRLVRPCGSGRQEAGIKYSDGELPEEHRTTVRGLRVSSVAWSLVDYARTATLEQAVVAMDSALHKGLVTKAEIAEVVERCRAWSGSRMASAALDLCDGRSESVGESRARVVMALLDLAPDELQTWIATDRGDVRVDFEWRSRRVVGEFDGRAKYQRFVPEGKTPSDVAWAERQREQALERAGWVVVRFTWADLADPALIRARLLEAFARAARLAGAAG